MTKKTDIKNESKGFFLEGIKRNVFSKCSGQLSKRPIHYEPVFHFR